MQQLTSSSSSRDTCCRKQKNIVKLKMDGSQWSETEKGPNGHFGNLRCKLLKWEKKRTSTQRESEGFRRGEVPGGHTHSLVIKYDIWQQPRTKGQEGGERERSTRREMIVNWRNCRICSHLNEQANTNRQNASIEGNSHFRIARIGKSECT